MPDYVLLSPGVDPIEKYGEHPQSAGGCSWWLLVLPLLLFCSCGALVNAAAPKPTPTPLPTGAALPTVTATLTPTLTPTPTATASASPTTPPASPTASASPTATLTATASPTAAPVEFVGEVSGANQLNVRYGPGPSWPIMQVLNRGARVRVQARDSAGRWGQLDGGGWVNLSYLSGLGDVSLLPVGDALPQPNL